MANAKMAPTVFLLFFFSKMFRLYKQFLECMINPDLSCLLAINMRSPWSDQADRIISQSGHATFVHISNLCIWIFDRISVSCIIFKLGLWHDTRFRVKMIQMYQLLSLTHFTFLRNLQS